MEINEILVKDRNIVGFDSCELLNCQNRNLSINEIVPLNSTGVQIFHTTDWGPKRDSLLVVVPISVIYVITFVTGLFGNVSTCIVIAKNKYLHTATNYYLFSLAISDLLLLVCGLPPEIYSIWSKYPYIFGETFCVMQGFFAETSANATVLTITAFTVERYIAICYPFLSHKMSKLSRAIRYIMLIWLVALCLAIPQAIAFGIVCVSDSTSEHCVCTLKEFVIPHAFEISTIVFFIIPMAVITVLYILIGLQLKNSRHSPLNTSKTKCQVKYSVSTEKAVVCLPKNDEFQRQNTLNIRDDSRRNVKRNPQATRHVIKMLIAVVAAFFICWAPFHAQRLLAIYASKPSTSTVKVFEVLTYVSGVLYYLSTTINPLLYHIMSNKFRKAFKKTFKKAFFEEPQEWLPKNGCYSPFNQQCPHSQSNTDSCSHSRQNSVRFDVDVGSLRESKRPLVISFKNSKKPSFVFNQPVTVLHSEF